MTRACRELRSRGLESEACVVYRDATSGCIGSCLDLCAIPGAISGAGLIFPEGDVQALVNRLHQLQTHY